MFSRITGSIVERGEATVVLDVGGLAYEIVLPPCVAEKIPRLHGERVTLEIHPAFSLDGNSGRFTFFGFTNPIERDFFEALTTVGSIGPKTAARAFSEPMGRIAQAIDAGDYGFLVKLPGIGQQKARDIVATAQQTAEQVRSDAATRATAEYDRIVGGAAADVAAARQHAIDEAAARLGEVVIEVVAKVIGREIDANAHRDLIDEAIGEFQLASKDQKRAVECASMLGLCFLEKGMPQLAIKWYRKGLEMPGIKDEEHLGLAYDLGSAYMEVGDAENAQKTFTEVYGMNSTYRDVSARIKQLEEQKR